MTCIPYNLVSVLLGKHSGVYMSKIGIFRTAFTIIMSSRKQLKCLFTIEKNKGRKAMQSSAKKGNVGGIIITDLKLYY
jgi:hypothetical protein